MDLSRIEIIENCDINDLTNNEFLEELIVSLGFNNVFVGDQQIEQPEIVIKNGGGLLIWQYPNQFSKYLCLLQNYPIQSYIEIGCCWGGTFVLTTEYLKKFRKLTKTTAVDLIDRPVVEYCQTQTDFQCSFMKINTHTFEFNQFISNNKYDLIFIDGDHSYEGVKMDYEMCKNSGKIFVFHDIMNDAVQGVSVFWNELKTTESDKYDFFEFTEQYFEVWFKTHKVFLGIGVAVLKNGFVV